MNTTSPRLAALERSLADGNEGALEEFWREMAERGTPLVEAVDDAPDRRLVTFLWRQMELEQPENVVVVNLLGPADFNTMRLSRLGTADVWFRSYVVRSNIRTVYQLALNDTLVGFADETDWKTRAKSWFVDPWNPRAFRDSAPSADPDAWHRVQSVLELPDAEPLPWFERRPGVPAGSVEQHRFASETLGNERDVWLYLPPGYDARAAPVGLLLLFDGEEARHVLDAPGTLDALLAASAIPPLAAVMVGQVERTNELPPNDDWITFLRDELLPWVRDRVAVSADPMQSIVSGLSYGGLSAAWCGLRLSDLFGNVLSQSGSFWWKPDPFEQERPAIAGEAFDYEWLNHQYIDSPTLPLRFYLDVGTMEGKATGNAPSHLHSNRHMRDVLRLKGYEVHYQEYAGGHDYLWWRETLAEGLIALVGTRD